MKTFRIGNEIQVRWPILTNGNETPLTGRNLKLFLSDDTGRKKEVVFDTEDNYVYFTYSPLEQKHVGVYFLTLFEDMGTGRQLCVDTCAFRLVAHSYEIPSDMKAEELELGAREVTAIRGRSAYEIAVFYGYEGTEEEWAAQYNTVLTSVETMEEQVDESRRTLVRVQMLEREMIAIHNEEEIRKQTENERKIAETGREEAEQGRVEAEEARVLAEQGRVEAEEARVAEERERNLRTDAIREGIAAYEESLRSVVDEIETASNIPINDRRRTLIVEQDYFSVEIQPNTMNIWRNPMPELNVFFAAGIAGYENEYMIRFTCPEDTPTVLWMPDVTHWANSTPLEPEKGLTYEVSVVDGLAAYAEYEIKEES